MLVVVVNIQEIVPRDGDRQPNWRSHEVAVGDSTAIAYPFPNTGGSDTQTVDWQVERQPVLADFVASREQCVEVRHLGNGKAGKIGLAPRSGVDVVGTGIVVVEERGGNAVCAIAPMQRQLGRVGAFQSHIAVLGETFGPVKSDAGNGGIGVDREVFGGGIGAVVAVGDGQLQTVASWLVDRDVPVGTRVAVNKGVAAEKPPSIGGGDARQGGGVDIVAEAEMLVAYNERGYGLWIAGVGLRLVTARMIIGDF